MHVRMLALILGLGMVSGVALAVVTSEGSGSVTDLPPVEADAEAHFATANARSLEWNPEAGLIGVIGSEGRFPRGMIDPPIAWDVSADPTPGNGLAIVWTYLYKAPDDVETFFVAVDGDGAIRYAEAMFTHDFAPTYYGPLLIGDPFHGSAHAVAKALGNPVFATYGAKHPVHGTVMMLASGEKGAEWHVTKASDMGFYASARVSAKDGTLIHVESWPRPVEPPCEAQPEPASDGHYAESSTTEGYACPPPPCPKEADCPPPCSTDSRCDPPVPPAPGNHESHESGTLGLNEYHTTFIPLESPDHSPVITVDLSTSGLPVRDGVRVTLRDPGWGVIDSVETTGKATLVGSGRDLMMWGEYVVTLEPVSPATTRTSYTLDMRVEYGEWNPMNGWMMFFDWFDGGFYILGESSRSHETFVDQPTEELIIAFYASEGALGQGLRLTVYDPEGNEVAYTKGPGEIRLGDAAPGHYEFVVDAPQVVLYSQHYQIEVKGFVTQSHPVHEVTPHTQMSHDH